MNTHLSEIFTRAHAQSRGVMIAYVTVGDPDLASTAEAVKALIDQGVDIVELGVPFSDPVADGPTIQIAAQSALEGGTTLDDVWDVALQAREHSADCGLIVMGYANSFFQHGLAATAKASSDAGINGWIVPDVPFEEAELFLEVLRPIDTDFVPLIAPTTPIPRAKYIISNLNPSFVYYVSVTGVTGARTSFEAGWQDPLCQLTEAIEAPVAVGFGISGPELAQEAAKYAQGVVVGSAIVGRLHEGQPPSVVAEFARQIRDAI